MKPATQAQSAGDAGLAAWLRDLITPRTSADFFAQLESRVQSSAPPCAGGQPCA